jgi:hypothetical protein
MGMARVCYYWMLGENKTGDNVNKIGLGARNFLGRLTLGICNYDQWKLLMRFCPLAD